MKRARYAVPRLIFIFGVNSARDMIKALTLDELDATFARAIARAATKGKQL